MNVVIDQKRCKGCGSCAEQCPDIFEIDDQKASVVPSQVPEESESMCQTVVSNCPGSAISELKPHAFILLQGSQKMPEWVAL